MGLKLVDVIRTLSELGTATPAFIALFDKVKSTFTESEQEVLQRAYEKAREKTNVDHEALQEDLQEAAKKK